MSLALGMAWRHLRGERPPRWSRPLALVAAALVLAGAGLFAWSSGQPEPATEDALPIAALGALLGALTAAIGLLLLGLAAMVRRFTLLVAITVYSVAQGCAALVVVLSLMDGLEHDLQERLLGHRAHLRVSAPPGQELAAPAELVGRLRALPELAGASPSLEGPVMLRSPFGRAGVTLVGVDPGLHAEVSGLPDEVIEGSYVFFAEPAMLPARGFVGLGEPDPEPELPSLDDDAPTDMPGETGPEGQTQDDEADEGGWEDPEQEIARLRAAGELPPAVPPVAPASGDEDEDEGEGWEDPEQEIPRLRAEGRIPPARPPVVAELEAEPEPEVEAEPDAEPDLLLAGPTIPVLLGRELADELSVGVGDPVQIITPEGRLTPAGLVPGVLLARVAAVYATGVYNDDRDFVYLPLPDAQAFLRAPDAATAIAIRLREPDALAAGKAAVAAAAGDAFVVEDWRQIHGSLFSAMFLEKVAMFVALLFVVLVAAFGILATNLMSVLERAPEIAILKAMGARDRLIAQVYALEGCIVGGLGCVGGIAAGLALCAWFGERGIPLQGAVFTLEALPLRTEPLEVALVAGAALVLVGLASVIPARVAASLRPVDGLRRGD